MPTIMSAEVKLRSLALQSADMVAIFGDSPMRYFDRQVPPGYVSKGTCLRVTRVGTVSNYVQEGPLDLEMIRFQFDALDFDPETARSAARVIQDFMKTVDLMSDAQFVSPPTTPSQFPNYQLNQRSTIEQPKGTALVYAESQGWRIFNSSNF